MKLLHITQSPKNRSITIIRKTYIILGLLILSGCGVVTIGEPPQPPPRDAASVTAQDVSLMIARFGPVIYLNSNERYGMDDPEYVLDFGASLSWGKVENPHSYRAFKLAVVESKRTSTQTLLDDVRKVKDSISYLPDPDDYNYWLKIDDSRKPGNPSQAKAWIHVLPYGRYSTEIQFWLFYPFNGPGRVEICASSKICKDVWLSQAGRHYSDWEMVSIVVSNTATQLQSVYMSRHDGGEIFQRWDDGTYRSTSNPRNTISFFTPPFKDMYNKHPIIFSAISSHAHYTTAGKHTYRRVFSKSYLLGTASADLFDVTNEGYAFRTFEPGRYRIISSDLPGLRVTVPDWLRFDGRWGQYEKLADKIKIKGIPIYPYEEIGAGPSGPMAKSEWKGAFN